MNTEKIKARIYEISNKQSRGGKRKIKLIIHEIMPDSSHFQENGISWAEKYVLNALDSLKGAPIAVEFINEEKSEIFGHGLTDEIETDTGRMPIFENSTVVGSIIEGYIDDVDFDGTIKKCLLADAWIYQQRYPKFVDYLIDNIPLGNVSGSVEINGLEENQNQIVYEDGYKEQGRIPQKYTYSAHALLGQSVKPADPAAKVLEINQKLNEKKEEKIVDEKILNEIVENIKKTIIETNSVSAEVNAQMAEKDAKIVELNASVEQLTAAMADVKKERDELWEKEDVLYKEITILKEEIAKAKIAERVGELNSAIANFTDSEKEFAKDEIEAFNADPMTVEINSIVDKIYAEIGKKNKEAEVEEQKNLELNSKKEKPEDIFGEVIETNSKTDEDISIF